MLVTANRHVRIALHAATASKSNYTEACCKSDTDLDSQSGHMATECSEPRSAANVTCKVCEESTCGLQQWVAFETNIDIVGHFAKDCPTKPIQACRNCG